MKKLIILVLLISQFCFCQNKSGVAGMMLNLSKHQYTLESGSIYPQWESTDWDDALGTSKTITFTTSVADDILIAQGIVWENTTFTPPSGWTIISQSASNTSQVAMWKRAVGGENSETFTSDGVGTDLIFFAVHRFSGCIATGIPYEDNQNQNASTLQNPTHNILAMTATGSNRLAVGLVFCGDNRTILTDVVDYTNVFSQPRATGLDAWLLTYTYQLPSTSSPLNTIDFDQNEGGGTINFLLLPE